MQHNYVFLLNIHTITIISLCTDYWILIKIRSGIVPPGCILETLRQFSLLTCGNRSYALVEQHTNLMRQCNDLTDGYRQRIALAGELYGKPCYWFITDVDGIWRKIESDWGLDIFALLSAILSLGVNFWALKEFLSKKPHHASRCLLTAAILYAIPVGTSFGIVHLTNTRQPKNMKEQMIYLEPSWSIFSAILSIGLMICASYAAHVQHKIMVERRESERRRRQLHNAIMTSCRQDIGLAIRARMTVI